MPAATLRPRDLSFLQDLGIRGSLSGAYAGKWLPARGPELVSSTPVTGEPIATVRQASAEDYEEVVAAAQAAFLRWREVPAPRRGEFVRHIGDRLRSEKERLGRLVSWEMGKILQEGLGEIQEAVDMADFAVGQSRMLYGLTIASERPRHALREQWHPLGVVGVITAFNFPAAVWSWNALLALACGDAVVWKPSSLTPLTAIAMNRIAASVLEPDGFGALLGLAVGRGSEVGERMLDDRRLPLVSFTGSTAMGRTVAERVARRFGRTILELGGNNAVIVMDDADLELAARAIFFGAVGTSGQRCTSTRRVLVHRAVKERLVGRLLELYGQVRIGNPLDPGTLMGPLADRNAVADTLAAIERVRRLGGRILCGGEVLELEGGCYLTPCIALVRNEWDVVQEETFGPLLHVIEVADLDDAIEKHNAVPQGLSSAIFTLNVRHAERFTGPAGSDCGIANVNAGTSGAEIGGAFGGEKETGGGRESGSDAWRAYMRRQTSVVNWGEDLPLAQGIQFG